MRRGGLGREVETYMHFWSRERFESSEEEGIATGGADIVVVNDDADGEKDEIGPLVPKPPFVTIRFLSFSPDPISII